MAKLAFTAVCFRQNQLTIIDYNRVVKDLNGLFEEEFLAKLEKNRRGRKGVDIYKPVLCIISPFGRKWYSLTAKQGTTITIRSVS